MTSRCSDNYKQNEISQTLLVNLLTTSILPPNFSSSLSQQFAYHIIPPTKLLQSVTTIYLPHQSSHQTSPPVCHNNLLTISIFPPNFSSSLSQQFIYHINPPTKLLLQSVTTIYLPHQSSHQTSPPVCHNNLLTTSILPPNFSSSLSQ